MPRFGPSGGLYRPLTEQQIRQIHSASLAVLERTGLHVENQEALDLYRQGGARVDGHRLFLTPAMVGEALEKAPSRVLLAGRDPAQDIALEGMRVYAGTGGSPTMVLDPGADTVRPCTLNDLADLVRVADALPFCDFITIPLVPTDIASDEMPLNRFHTCLRHTTKHVMGGVYSLEGARQVVELGTILAGGLEALQARPFISNITSWMVSPLHLDTNVTQILIEWCRYGLPVALSSAPMAGSTSPMTLAGTLVQLNAEQLSGVVLAQLIRPGAPVLAGYIPGVADMRTGGYLGGAVEFGMMQASAAQMAHFYHLPIYCSGGMSDSKLPDMQAGWEQGITNSLAGLAGLNMCYEAVGMHASLLGFCLESLVLGDDLLVSKHFE
jgi:trimethylamine--corrinoid protein Co-methyltransferase